MTLCKQFLIIKKISTESTSNGFYVENFTATISCVPHNILKGYLC